MFRPCRAIIRPYYKNMFIHTGLVEPVLIARPDDGPIRPKHVALYVLLMVIIEVLEENINTLFKHGTHRDK